MIERSQFTSVKIVRSLIKVILPFCGQNIESTKLFLICDLEFGNVFTLCLLLAIDVTDFETLKPYSTPQPTICSRSPNKYWNKILSIQILDQYFRQKN